MNRKQTTEWKGTQHYSCKFREKNISNDYESEDDIENLVIQIRIKNNQIIMGYILFITKFIFYMLLFLGSEFS